MLIALHNPRTAGGSLNSALMMQFGTKLFFNPDERPNPLDPTLVPEGTEAITTFQPITLMSKAPGDAWVTSLRDPVERIVDLFNFFALPDPLLGEKMTKREYVTPSEVYHRKAQDMLEYDNGMVRRIAGVSPQFGRVTPEHLDLAKENLAKFDEVFFQSTFDADYAAAAAKYGWTAVPDLWNSISIEVRPVSFYSKHIAAITEANSLDIALVEYARELRGV